MDWAIQLRDSHSWGAFAIHCAAVDTWPWIVMFNLHVLLWEICSSINPLEPRSKGLMVPYMRLQYGIIL